MLKLFIALILTATLAGCNAANEAPAVEETPVDPPTVEETSINYPVYLSTMTHMEGDWNMAATDEGFFDRQVNNVRRLMDLADPHGAILTFETDIPFAEGMINFDLNLWQEAIDRGHDAGTHSDLKPSEKRSLEDNIEEFKLRKDLVDDLIGDEENIGTSGGGGYSDWYNGAVGAGYKYLGGLVGFQYLALPLNERPDGWTDKKILSDYYHYPPPYDWHHYPFLIGDLSLKEDPNGDLMINGGSIGVLDSYYEKDGDFYGYEAECGKKCKLTQEDTEAAVDFIRDFVQKHDGSRPGKIVFYLPSKISSEENEEQLSYFFERMADLVEEDLVVWASQDDTYYAAMDYYQSL